MAFDSDYIRHPHLNSIAFASLSSCSASTHFRGLHFELNPCYLSPFPLIRNMKLPRSLGLRPRRPRFLPFASLAVLFFAVGLDIAVANNPGGYTSAISTPVTTGTELYGSQPDTNMDNGILYVRLSPTGQCRFHQISSTRHARSSRRERNCIAAAN